MSSESSESLSDVGLDEFAEEETRLMQSASSSEADDYANYDDDDDEEDNEGEEDPDMEDLVVVDEIHNEYENESSCKENAAKSHSSKNNVGNGPRFKSNVSTERENLKFEEWNRRRQFKKPMNPLQESYSTADAPFRSTFKMRHTAGRDFPFRKDYARKPPYLAHVKSGKVFKPAFRGNAKFHHAEGSASHARGHSSSTSPIWRHKRTNYYDWLREKESRLAPDRDSIVQKPKLNSMNFRRENRPNGKLFRPKFAPPNSRSFRPSSGFPMKPRAHQFSTNRPYVHKERRMTHIPHSPSKGLRIFDGRLVKVDTPSNVQKRMRVSHEQDISKFKGASASGLPSSKVLRVIGGKLVKVDVGSIEESSTTTVPKRVRSSQERKKNES